MPEKELNNNGEWIVNIIPFCFVIALSCLGGILNYLNRINKGGIAFNFFKFSLEVATSGFVGVITFLLCDIAELRWSITAALCAISGHMGTRALFLIEKPAIQTVVNLLKRNGYYEENDGETQTNNAKKPGKRKKTNNAKSSKKV